MSPEMYLTGVSYLAGAVIYTAFCIALTLVAVFYCWKMAHNLITKNGQYIEKIKTSKAFEVFTNPTPNQEAKKPEVK